MIRIKTGTFLLMLLITIFLQFILHRFFSFLVGVDLYTIFVYFLSKRMDLKKLLIYGSFVGIVEDISLSFSIPIGVNGISKLFVALFAFYISKVLSFENPLLEILIVGFLTVLDKVVVISVFSLFGIPFHFSKLLLFVISPVTNGAFYLIFFLITEIRKWK